MRADLIVAEQAEQAGQAEQTKQVERVKRVEQEEQEGREGRVNGVQAEEEAEITALIQSLSFFIVFIMLAGPTIVRRVFLLKIPLFDG